jgi:hypothetical protein
VRRAASRRGSAWRWTTRFASQWLRLQDLSLIQPNPIDFPEFHMQLARSMRRETEQFFHHLVKEDRPFLEFFTADYTFMDERLARHYGVPVGSWGMPAC